MPDFSDISKRILVLSKNFIRTIYEEHLPRGLRIADFGTNSIHSDGLPFQWTEGIQEIYLDCNYISDTDGVRWSAGLKKLVLSQNPLRSPPEMLPEDLEVLLLDRTDLEALDELPANLRTLNISKCKFRRLPKQCPLFLQVLLANENQLTFRGLPTTWGMSLKILNLDRNRLNQFPSGLPDCLESLSLNYNEITEVPENLPENLKHLSVIGNRVREVHLKRRKTPFETVFLNDNQLLESVEDTLIDTGLQWTQIIWEADNWFGPEHKEAASRIQKFWKVVKIPRTLRAWLKTARIKDELLEVSMHPSRIGQFEELSNAWYKMV